MFIGHFAPAFAAAAITNESPRLGTLFIAAQLVDWAFFTFALIGVEHLRIVPGITAMNPMDLYHMPYTHSLLGSAAWAAAFALVVWWFTRNVVMATWAALVVLSHWLLDLLVHRPDLTLAGGEDKLGLGLWNSPMVEMPLELGITALAFLWYVKRTKGPLLPPVVLGLTLLLFQAIDWFGPAPAAAGPAMYLTALAAYGLLTALAFWAGATRWHKTQVGLSVASPRR